MASEIEIIRYKDVYYSLGLAIDLLRESALYRKLPLGNVSDMLMGQIKRGHSCFLSQNGSVIGYCGWALCEKSVAEDWVNREYSPKYRECVEGNCLVIVTLYCEKSKGLYSLKSFFKSLYINYPIYGMRNYLAFKRPVLISPTNLSET